MDQLVLNSLELAIENVRLTDVAGQETNTTVGDVVVEAETEKLIVNLNSQLQPGQYHLKIAFKGIIISKMKGLYHSKYVR